MTAAVQLGFVAGAIASAVLALPDRISARRLFAASALAGAIFNAVLATMASSAGPAIALRFATGVCLAGVYPPGMKVAASFVGPERRGLAIAILVAALTMGSATPHLVAQFAADVSHRVVLLASSGLATLGALLALSMSDGRYSPPTVAFDRKQVWRVLRHRPTLLANGGYFGHMWELYGMWAWLLVFMTAAPQLSNYARMITFVTIGVFGAAGALAGGHLADRYGRTALTIGAMTVSALCCLLSPLFFGAPVLAMVIFGAIWGSSIIADSAQFSAAVTELTEPEAMGTALTVQTSIGFALTMIPIWGLPLVAEGVGWRYALMFLAPGPLLGCIAMWMLRRRPEAQRMASGRR